MAARVRVDARSSSVIGKPLSQRYGIALHPLAAEEAAAIVRERLAEDGAALVQVRARDPRMIACLFVRADATAVRLCRELGLEMKLGGSGVLGVLGADVARLFADLVASRRTWLETPCGDRETKVLLVAGGIAMLSIEVSDGKAVVTPVA
jgi:hypothetical protein